MRNTDLIKKIDTGDLNAGGILLPEQSQKFFQMTFDATPFSKMHRKEQRRARTGEIDKIAIGGRLLRKKTEDTDDNYRAGVTHGKVEYATIPVRLPWEITEETLRENIEGEGYEDLVMGMMTTQVGIDLEDLHWNGDSTLVADPFLSVNDGWLKKMADGNTHVVDCTADTKFNKGTFFNILGELPNKYRSEKLRWMMSPNRALNWIEYLTGRATGAGDAALSGSGALAAAPLGIPIVPIPSFGDDKIVLGDPQNFVAVWTYNVRIRKTTEGREAVMQDKRFYVVHFDDDPVIQELDACVLANNLTATTLTD